MRISDWSSDVCSSDLPASTRYHKLSHARRRVFGATHSVRYGGHFRFRGQRLFIRNAEGESCPDGYGLGCQGSGRGGAGELWAVHHACGCRAVSWYLEQHLRAGKALMGSTIYLDYQATTPLAPEEFAAMTPWLRDQFANPHSAHRLGRMAAAGIEVARGQVLELLGGKGRLVFTSGATEAINMGLIGGAKAMRDRDPDRIKIVTIDTERSEERGVGKEGVSTCK